MVVALAGILVLVAYRALPFVACVFFSSGVSARGKGIAAVLLVVLTAGAWALGANIEEVVVRAPIALLYFALLGLGVYEVAPFLARGILGEGGLFVVLATACVLLPALVVGRPLATATVLLGWNVLLSAHSYAVDTADERARPSRSACLFFLVVNPTLVWAERGRRSQSAGLYAKGVLRIAAGAATWLLQDALDLAVKRPNLLGAGVDVGATFGAAYRSFLVYGAARAASLYFAHSGLASIQIGLCRLLGYEVPERYRYPFLAKSPEDFWRRWNIWIGAWAKRYLFFPAALSLRRRWRKLPLDLGKAAAVLVTFAGIGLLHEFVAYARVLLQPTAGAPSLGVTLAFVVFSLMLLGWLGVTRLGLSLPPLRGLASAPWSRAALVVFSWIVFTHVTYLMAFLAMPESTAGVPMKTLLLRLFA